MALAPKYILLTSGTSWTVPADWNSSANIIHLIGGGGSGTITTGGGGGGGGGYTKVTNFAAAPGSTITYAIGSGGGSSSTPSAGGNTTFNAGAYSAGGGGVGTSAPAGGAGGTGTTYNGGSGSSSGGGGGAGGPNGAGNNGSGTNGGSGDAGFGGVGASGTPSFGGIGTEIWPAGTGSGGGNSSNNVAGVSLPNYGNNYGGGGAGSQFSPAINTYNSFSYGSPGAIIIVYYGSSSGYTKDDPVFGTIDLDDQYVTDSWLIDKYVGGTLFTWGPNNFGEIGNSSSGNYYSSPVQVGALNNWKQITCGGLTVMGIKNDGTMWGWGYGFFGTLMTGTNVNINSSPVQVGALTSWKQVSVFLHSLAIKNDGTLWAAGNNQFGNLGNGNITSYSSPIQIGALTNWKQSSTSYYTSAVVKLDGTLWMWGSNFWGQLGQGYASATSYYSSPLQVGTLTNWKQVSASGGQTYAIKTDGTLWSWGGNGYGQLGNGNRTYYSSPVQVGTLTNWKYVSTSQDSAVFAIKTDGTLWAWGTNICGELGIGVATSLYYSSPVQVGSLTNWKYVAGGGGNAPPTTQVLAIKTDGTLWSWGFNQFGNLGNGNITYYSSPVQVGSLTNWKSVSGGNNCSAGITFADLT